MKTRYSIIYIIPVLLSILVYIISFTVFIFMNNNQAFNDGSKIINTLLCSQFGDFMSGVLSPLLSFSSVLLIFSSLVFQNIRKTIESIEKNYFVMLEIHRSNVENIYVVFKDKEYKGSYAFLIMHKCIMELIELIREENEFIKMKKKRIIEIAFLVFFFGSKDTDIESLQFNLLKGLKQDEKMLTKGILLKTSNMIFSDIIGQQVNLAHYFRHLFHTVSFIDRNKYLSDVEKYNYIKILRAQLSQYELTIFFFNSFTRYASSWNTRNYIITYKLFKNIPPGICGGLNPKDFFDITYEWEIE